MSHFIETVRLCLSRAVPATIKSLTWLLQLMVPISFAVALLQYYGIIAWIASYINPFFCHFNLPGESAVAFISGAAAGTYAGIAVMMSIHLTLREATIMGIMIAICHALPMECAVNHKTGSSFWKMGVIRICAAFLCAAFLDWLLPEMPEQYIYMGAQSGGTLMDVLQTWFVSQSKMAVVIALIIYSLMVVQRFIEIKGLLKPLSRVFAPLMSLFGLPRNSSYMWLVGNVLGISYGSAVMVELKEHNLITSEDAKSVNYHLIMNHSMLEDTIVFAATGISGFLVVFTRMLFAVLLVWGKRCAEGVISRIARS